MCRVTIDTLNTWTNFARAYYLSGMFGARRTNSARIAVANPHLSEQYAIENAIVISRPTAIRRLPAAAWHRREEPTWHDPNVFQRICAGEGFSNLVEIQAAFSAGYRVFSDLPVFRNYFAHRNQGTLKAAVGLAPLHGIPATRRPSEILLTRPIGRIQPLILEFIDEIEFTVEYLCD